MYCYLMIYYWNEHSDVHEQYQHMILDSRIDQIVAVALRLLLLLM